LRLRPLSKGYWRGDKNQHLMTEPVSMKLTRPKSQSVLSEADLIPTGTKGYRVHDFTVESNQITHSFVISVAVKQLPNRLDDVRFFLFDDAQFSLWSIDKSAFSAVLAPSLVRADFIFKPQHAGKYHIVLDNRHSTFTSKTVTITVEEEWLVEEGIEPRISSTEPKVSQPSKARLWSRLVGWFRAVPLITSILAFFSIEMLAISFGIVVATHVAPTLGLRSGDPWPFIAAIAFGGIVVFGIFYVAITGRPLPMAPPMT